MDAMARLNQAMRYIEQQLCGEMDYSRLAQLAGCSEYQFRRMFSFLAGMPLGEYIRRRRLSRAAELLRAGRETVLDVAVQMGYESPDSFCKAFQAMHGVTPSQAKRNAAALKSFPPLSFHLVLKGGDEMDYRIVDKGAFFIMGAGGRIPLIYNGPNPHTADVWRKLRQEDLLVLMEYAQQEPKGILNVYANYQDKTAEGTELNLYVGVVMHQPMPERFQGRFDVLQVDASTWAVFTTVEKKPFQTQETWARIYSQWLQTSGYEWTGGPEMLWQESYDFSKPDFKTEIWVPVRKTAEQSDKG